MAEAAAAAEDESLGSQTLEFDDRDTMTQDQQVAPVAVVSDDEKAFDSEEPIDASDAKSKSGGCCPKSKCGCCGLCCRCLARWPRTSGLLLGIVFPLFLLILVSVFFGYFLAQLEGPGEVETNNDILATRVALQFQRDLVGNITEALPHICACTFLTEEKLELEAAEQYQGCLLLQAEDIANQTSAYLNSTNSTAVTSTAGNSTNETAAEIPVFTSNITCREPVPLESIAIEETIQRIFVEQFEICEVDTNPALDNVQLCGETGLLNFPKNLRLNPSDLLVEMDKCGKQAFEIMDKYRMSDVIANDLLSSDISFNWIRCSGKSDPNATDADKLEDLMNSVLNPFADLSHLLPSAQEEAAVNAWTESQSELYCQYLDEALTNGLPLTQARQMALEKSIAEADGFGDCIVNGWAGGWFWFTVMTTIGYGNTAPVTEGARAMVFTLGFFSILLFAGVLAKAGSIVTDIIDDFLERMKLSFLTRPSVQALIWGSFYYLWSFMIAAHYIYWSEDRLGTEIDYKDAYWYAYITTTTVGLGDYYLEHGVIVGMDLLVWPLLILFGFVLLSSFLTKVGELLSGLFSGGGEVKSFKETLAEPVFFSCCPNVCRKEPSDGEELTNEDEDAVDDANDVDKVDSIPVAPAQDEGGSSQQEEGDGDVDSNKESVTDGSVIEADQRGYCSLM